jgi:hypothetical protein
MNKHKLITAASKDDNPADHVFLEIEQDRFLEVKNRPDEITHESIHDSFPTGLKTKTETGWRFQIALAERYIRLQFPDAIYSEIA